MSTSTRHRPAHRARQGFRLRRSAADRVIAGVAAGLGERLGIDPVVVRLAFVVLAFAGGFGLVLYLGCWLVSADPAPSASQRGAGANGQAPALRGGMRQTIAVALVVSGMLLLLRAAGVWFGDGLVWPIAVAAFGSAIIWTRSDETGRAKWSRLAARLPFGTVDSATGRVSRGRVAGGALLIVGGMAMFLAANNALVAARNVVFAVVVTGAGIGLILGPWMLRMGRQLGEERRERIRSEERADVAAHLHDSVLQTLALIQRSSEPQEMVALARGQERELRSWLFGHGRSNENGSELLGDALDEIAGRVERLHGVTVETVVVGDEAVDERLRAMVDAAGEAMSNAAKHSGARGISVYAEIRPDGANLYVRDEGRGFDPSHLPPDRRGIADSIEGRMERHGGAAMISSRPGEGTEVHLRMPRGEQ